MMNKKGFTLIEVVIYLAIVGVVVNSFISFSVAIANNKNKTYVVAEVQDNSRAIMELLNRHLKEAGQVLTPEIGSSSSQLVLNMSETGQELSFWLENNELYYQIDGSFRQKINSDETAVNELVFYNVGSGDASSIKYNYRIEYKNNDSKSFDYFETINSSVSLKTQL